jgi:methyl-accepting chemotaxis protein
MKKLLIYLLAEYSSASLEIQKKARILTYIHLFIFISMVCLLPITIFMQHVPGFIIIFFTAGIQIISLAFIRKKKYKVSSNIMILYIFAGNSSSVLSNLYGTNMSYTEIYIYGFIQMFLIIYACLISYSKWQVFMITTLCIIGATCLYFFRTLPYINWEISMFSITPIITVAFMLGAGGFIGWLILGMTKELIRVAEREALSNKHRYERLEMILTATKEGMVIGEDLIVYSSNTSDVMRKINDVFISIKNEIGNLHSVIDISQQVNIDVVQSTESVKAIIDQQNSAISESSSSIHEMTSSIRNISDIMNTKKEAVNRLLNSAHTTKNEIEQSIDLINKISKSSDKINEIIESIMNISGNINILSLNAAIEAAHAGEFGKGFNVVAEEIKKLAEDTGSNTKEISVTLNTNIADIKKAEKINDNAGEYFQKLSGEIGDLIKSIEEASTGLQELSTGTNEIVKAVGEMVSSSGEVVYSMNEMAEKANKSINTIKAVDISYNTIQQKIEEIYNYFNMIKEEIVSIDKIGEKNIKHIKNMDEEIVKIREDIY